MHPLLQAILQGLGGDDKEFSQQAQQYHAATQTQPAPGTQPDFSGLTSQQMNAVQALTASGMPVDQAIAKFRPQPGVGVAPPMAHPHVGGPAGAQASQAARVMPAGAPAPAYAAAPPAVSGAALGLEGDYYGKEQPKVMLAVAAPQGARMAAKGAPMTTGPSGRGGSEYYIPEYTGRDTKRQDQEYKKSREAAQAHDSERARLSEQGVSIPLQHYGRPMIVLPELPAYKKGQ